MMRGKPPGSVVRLTIDTLEADPLTDGDCLITAGGSIYAVIEARRMRSALCRVRATCIKLASPEAIPTGARLRSLTWHPRKRRK